MPNNSELFFECLNNPVINVDPYTREILNKVVIPTDSNISNELLSKNSQLIELIIEYNNYIANGDFSHIEEIISGIDECLKYEGMNYCPFSQYLMVHDVNYNMYLCSLNIDEKKYILDCYIKDRHQMYINRDYSEIVFQVLADNYSHKRKGKLGVKKIKKICEDFGLDKLTDEGDIDKSSYYILPDSDGKKMFKLILKKFNIDFKFEHTHQGKMPDALIKINNNFVIVEHKTSKELGGGQDKQMTEIIDFIGYGERGIFYVSYLDGILFNDLKNPKKNNKLYRDKKNIIDNLNLSPYNYFVNDYGFNKLLKALVSSENL